MSAGVKPILIIRAWIVLLMSIMLWNAVVSPTTLLEGWLRPTPFVLFAALAATWFFYVWHINAIIWLVSFIAVGTFLRGLEIFLFATEFSVRLRLGPSSLWFLATGTTVCMGILNILAASKRQAELALLGGGW